MTHQVLLISHDSALAARLRRALPAGIPTDLHCAVGYQPCPDPRGWLLLLLDAPSAPAMGNAVPPTEKAPIVWLGTPPLLTAVGGWHERPGQIVDYVARGGSPSKWAMILHQHLAAAYLRRMRAGGASSQRFAPPRTAGDLERQLNNALTGIIGNAGLAIDSGRRLPPPLVLRLQRISELAVQMREALAVLLTLRPPPHSPA